LFRRSGGDEAPPDERALLWGLPHTVASEMAGQTFQKNQPPPSWHSAPEKPGCRIGLKRHLEAESALMFCEVEPSERKGLQKTIGRQHSSAILSAMNSFLEFPTRNC
jgi:hypothetical protein